MVYVTERGCIHSSSVFSDTIVLITDTSSCEEIYFRTFSMPRQGRAECAKTCLCAQWARPWCCCAQRARSWASLCSKARHFPVYIHKTFDFLSINDSIRWRRQWLLCTSRPLPSHMLQLLYRHSTSGCSILQNYVHCQQFTMWKGRDTTLSPKEQRWNSLWVQQS